MTRSILPVAVVVLALLATWYVAAVWLNADAAHAQAERAGERASIGRLLSATMSQRRPVLPAPHQVAAEIWTTTVETPPGSPRSLLFHGWATLSATLLGFVIGTALGIGLAVLIVHSRAMELSLMPWVNASQAIPILVIAPMIIVVLHAVGIAGLLPKALIATYLSVFPVTIGMAAGLRAPQRLQLDLMRTYDARAAQTLVKLRWPAATPYLFSALKVAIAASLAGVIVGELPTGAAAGLGARLLAGSYHGQTVQIWSALIAAAALAGVLAGLVGLANRIALRRMGMAR